jgi:hypothetical protein
VSVTATSALEPVNPVMYLMLGSDVRRMPSSFAASS